MEIFNNKSKNRVQGIEFNETGTKLFLIFHGQSTLPDADGGGPRLTRLLEYKLSTPYDITDLSLVTTAGIELEDEVSNPQTMRFSANGKRIFIIDHLIMRVVSKFIKFHFPIHTIHLHLL